MKSFAFLLALVAALSVADAFIIHSKPVTFKSCLQMTLLTYGSKKMDFKPGSPLKNACAALGVKPKYSCKKGDCGSCTITVAGTRVKACVGKVPPEPKLKSLQEKGLPIK